MPLLLLLAGGTPGPVRIAIDPAVLTWIGQGVDVVQSGGGATEVGFVPADTTWVGQSFTILGGLPPAAGLGAPMAFLPIKYGAAVTIPFDLIKAGALDFAASADWTPVAGDVKVSIDGGAFANVGTLPSVLSGTDWGQPLTTLETTGKFISVKVIDTATKAIEDQSLKCFTYGHPAAYWPFDLSQPLSSQTVSSAQVVSSVAGNVTGSVASVTTVNDKTGYTVSTVSDKTGYSLANPAGLKKNTAWPNFSFAMYNASTGALMPGLGTAVNAQRRIDNGAVATCANGVTEVSAGIYTIDLTSGDLNGDAITLLFTATGAQPRDFQIVTEP